MKKLTKIVATIGPATESVDVLTQLVQAGMNIARFNTKHSDPDWHSQRIERVRKVAHELNAPIGVLVDLQGPEIRIDLPNQQSFTVNEGEQVIFTSNRQKEGKNMVFIPHEVIGCMSRGGKIILDDGACEFVISNVEHDTITAQTITKCEVKHRKTMNTPGTILSMPSITERDKSYLDKIAPELIDYIGLSFVRNRQDILNLKKEMAIRNIKATVVSKIENQAALDNLDEIIAESDAVMIARGDLGVEVAYQQLVYWQKEIINRCRVAAKPVITATQMLKSMVDNPRPTRAEVSDVAHAVYDGTDAVMLSEETTIGHYPVESVRTQAEIASYNEEKTQIDFEWPHTTDSNLNITTNAANLIMHSQQKIDRVICLTETGQTARLLSRFRLKQPIHAVTHLPETYRRLALSYGVMPYLTDFPNGKLEINDELITKFQELGITKTGETTLFIHGTVWNKPGLTNTLALINT